jgi:hypothetical protein
MAPRVSSNHPPLAKPVVTSEAIRTANAIVANAALSSPLPFGRGGRTRAAPRRLARVPRTARNARRPMARYARDVRRALKPRPWRADDVAREEREARRHLDPAGELRGRDCSVCVVHAHRGADRPCEPVERGVREDLVFREAPFDVPVAVAPRPEFLDDPRSEPGWRVGQSEGRGLGLGAVHGGVGALGLAPGRGVLEPRALLWREVRLVAGEHGHARSVRWAGDDPLGVIECEVAAHLAADVSARRTEPRVAQDATPGLSAT